MLTLSLLCSFRASINLPSQTDVIIPGFIMKFEKSGSHWSLQIVLIYSVSVPVTRKYLNKNTVLEYNIVILRLSSLN